MNSTCHCNDAVTQHESLHAVVDYFDPHISAPAASTHRQLDGVHIGVKDMVAIVGVVKGNGNPSSKKFGAPEKVNAPVITQLLSAGAEIALTTSLLEYAAGAQHPDVPETRNPQDPTLTAGGSSSGSAALVGAGVLSLAVGTDTGGSIRIPAAYCACYGVKPTYNAINLEGVTPLAPSFDHLGFLGSSIGIMERALSATLPDWNRQPVNSDPARMLRIGIPRVWVNDSRNDRRIQERFNLLSDSLAAAGHSILDFDVANLEAIRRTFMPMILFEAWEVHREQMERDPLHYGDDTRRLLQFAQTITLEQYTNARSEREELLPRIQQEFQNVDLLMMPAVPYFAPEQTPPLDSELGAYEGLYTEVFNATGHPALVAPCSCAPMKMGVQLVGHSGADRQLLADAELIDPFLK